MNNVIEIDGEKAVIAVDPEIQMLRGEFVGLNGGADFHAESVRDLIEEGRKSLAYLEMCRERASNRAGSFPAGSMSASIPATMPRRSSQRQRRVKA